MDDDHIDKTLTLLRDQVDALQIAAAEKRKPWHSQPSFILSCIALVVSLTFSTLSVYFRNSDRQVADMTGKIARVRQNIIALADLQTDFVEASQRHNDNLGLVAQLNANMNAKREMLIEETESLIGLLGEHVTASEYLNFGQQMSLDARVDEALKYFDRARDLAPNDLARVAAYRALAFTLLQPGQASKPVEGREYARKAVDLLEKRDDQYSLFLSADILQGWAFAEHQLGSLKLADSLVERSNAFARRLTVGSPQRVQMDSRLALPFGAVALPVGAVAAPAAQRVDVTSILGSWVLRFADGRTGSLVLAPNPATGLWSAQTSVNSGKTVVELRNGTAFPSDGSALLIAWTIQRIGATGMSTMTSGNFRLQRSGDGFVGSDEPLGGEVVAVSAGRH